jgi:hypothetical protein
MIEDWLFDNPPNTASFTTKFVLDGSPILRVYRDYDSDWQFHGAPDQPATNDICRVVGLGCMIDRDPSLAELHDLPCGWRATRGSTDVPWVREKNNPFASFETDGYYVENAVWMASYRDDVNPPAKEIRDNLPVGAYAKLLFRFAAEDAERQDREVERMWVKIATRDDDDNYVGTLENDPIHNAVLTCGDPIHFHPLHVMEVLTDNGV